MRGLKKYWILIILFHSAMVCAQRIGDLDGIYYQAVALDDEIKQIPGKDIEAKPLYNREIAVIFTITKGVNGSEEWHEKHVTTTDKYGLFTLTIGKGEPMGSVPYSRLLDIPWIDADQWLKVEISTKNDGNYKIVSYQKFMAVPYSFYTDDIADDAITTEKILDSAILNRDIHTSSVDSRTILDSTIINRDLATSSADSRTLLDSTIVNEDLHTGSVDTRVILDSTLLNQDIATSSVDSRTLLDSTIINEDLHTGSVDTRVILDTTIQNIDMGTGSVESRVIEDGSVQNSDLADSSIDLTAKVQGILPVVNGGTGTDSFVSGGLLIGNGKSPVKTLSAMNPNEILVSTNADPVMKALAGGKGIKVTQTADSVILDYTLSNSVNANGSQQINVGVISSGTTYISSAFPVPGSGSGTMGDIVLASIDKNLQGCMLTAYFFSSNTIKVAIFNGTGSNVNLGTVNVKLLIVQ